MRMEYQILEEIQNQLIRSPLEFDSLECSVKYTLPRALKAGWETIEFIVRLWSAERFKQAHVMVNGLEWLNGQEFLLRAIPEQLTGLLMNSQWEIKTPESAYRRKP